MEKRRFVCVCSGTRTGCTVLELDNSGKKIRDHKSFAGVREACEATMREKGYELKVGDCYESYEGWRQQMKATA